METRTQDGHTKRTQRGQKPLPHGYRVRVMADGRQRKNPALLIVNGKVHEAFPTKREAISAGHELAAKEKEFGREVRAFDVAEWRRYLTAKRDHFAGKEPNWAALSHRMTLETSAMTVAAAVEKYRTQRAGDGLAGATQTQIKKKLERLSASLGSKKLHEVTVEDVRGWLAGLKFEAWTVRDHLKIVNTFWQHARREKWCLDNPCDAVTPPKVPHEEINILTVAEAAKLFEANKDQPCIGRLALEAFGGLRFSSAGRLLPEKDIRWADKGIELPGSKHKSGRRQYIDGLPDNLWPWLERIPMAGWLMEERRYERAKIEAFIRAGVTSSQNCLRHSFATYHVALHKDASKTAVLMQHTSAAMLFKHYKGNATSADAAKYFQIHP